MVLRGQILAREAEASGLLLAGKPGFWTQGSPEDDVRYTLIQPNGTVIADTHYRIDHVINLGSEEDVRLAKANGWGLVLRDLTGRSRTGIFLSKAIYDGHSLLGVLRLSTLENTIRPRQHEIFVARFSAQIAIVILLLGSFTFASHRRKKPLDELIEDVDLLQRGHRPEPLRIPYGNPVSPIAVQIAKLVEAVDHQEQTISEQRHRQRVLLNNMSEGILAVDNQSRIAEMNPVACQWLGIDDSLRARGQQLYSICRHPQLFDMISSLLEHGEAQECDLLLTGNQEKRLLHLRGSLMIDQERSVGVLVVMRDVTELRQLETVRQDFVSNVSHELKTPVTSMRGYAELILDDPSDIETTTSFTEKILKQSERMELLIKDLLDLSKLETTEEPDVYTNSEILPILESVVEQCKESASLKQLTIDLIADDALSADLHAALFEQAVFNLVQNAVKYTNPNTTVTVKAWAEDEHLILTVADQGPGIATHHQSRLFERFYRVDRARSRQVGGTGLGLSIVKHIAQNHHGRVTVSSMLNAGATFRMEVPLKAKQDG